MEKYRHLIRKINRMMLVWLVFAGQIVLAQSVEPNSGRASRATPKASSVLLMPLTNMLSNMKAFTPSGDPDLDYLILTRMHHQGGVDLARTALRSSADPRLLTLAKMQAADLESDIIELDAVQKKLRADEVSQPFLQQTSQKLQAMTADIQRSLKGRLSGNLDADFLTLMIQHHQDGIDLAQAYLPHARDAVLRAHAQRLIVAGRKEQELMKEMQP